MGQQKMGREKILRSRSRISVQCICGIVADRAGAVFLPVTVKIARLYSSRDSSRRASAGGLPAAAPGRREAGTGSKVVGGAPRPGGRELDLSRVPDRLFSSATPRAPGPPDVH